MVIINRLLPRTTKLLFFRKFSTEIVHKSENYTQLGHSINLFNKELASFRNEINSKFDSTNKQLKNDMANIRDEIKRDIYANKNEIKNIFSEHERLDRTGDVTREINIINDKYLLFFAWCIMPVLINIIWWNLYFRKNCSG
ncbi:hypothetical protein ACQ4LE_007886 [Meloidogyne hapla]|uniref:Uncharacterized protein n=1 Tax=Meloidogyne hapla TaxID=6305 RepID=A0A1I8B2Q0_MELHA